MFWGGDKNLPSLLENKYGDFSWYLHSCFAIFLQFLWESDIKES